MTDGFDALHPVLQHHVVNTLGWPRLRALQHDAIRPILSGSDALLLAPTVGWMAPAALLAGFAISPVLIVAFGLVEDLVAPEARTEGFAWLNSGLGVGVAGGFGADGAMDLLHQADVAVVFGASLNQFTMRFGELFSPGTRLIQIDLSNVATHPQVSDYLHADETEEDLP